MQNRTPTPKETNRFRHPKPFFPILCALFLLTAASGCDKPDDTAGTPSPPAAQRPEYEGTIVAVGDSLTEGYGVEQTEAYPALLEQKLRADGCNWRVINAGVSAETSSGTKSRTDWILTLKPDIVILETGANDGLRGIDTDLVRENLDAIVKRFKDNGVVVVLAGMEMVRNLGKDYTRRFRDVYPEIARENDLILIPFFLENVAGKPALNQADGIHPLPEGYRIVVETIYPYVLQAIDRVKAAPAS